MTYFHAGCLEGALGFCISNKIPDAAGPRTSLRVAKL